MSITAREIHLKRHHASTGKHSLKMGEVLLSSAYEVQSSRNLNKNSSTKTLWQGCWWLLSDSTGLTHRKFIRPLIGELRLRFRIMWNYSIPSMCKCQLRQVICTKTRVQWMCISLSTKIDRWIWAMHYKSQSLGQQAKALNTQGERTAMPKNSAVYPVLTKYESQRRKMLQMILHEMEGSGPMAQSDWLNNDATDPTPSLGQDNAARLVMWSAREYSRRWGAVAVVVFPKHFFDGI